MAKKTGISTPPISCTVIPCACILFLASPINNNATVEKPIIEENIRPVESMTAMAPPNVTTRKIISNVGRCPRSPRLRTGTNPHSRGIARSACPLPGVDDLKAAGIDLLLLNRHHPGGELLPKIRPGDEHAPCDQEGSNDLM